MALALTVDLLVSAFWSTAFHPLLCTLPPTIVLARGASLRSGAFSYSIVYTLSVLALRLFLHVDASYASGHRRPVHWKDEVVVVSGGAGGLGGLIAAVYALRGVSVAVVDVRSEADEGLKWEEMGASYYSCDVANEENVRALAQRVKMELGAPTIVINAAAIVSGTSMLTLEPADLSRTLSVNVTGAYSLIHAFLPDMLGRAEGGTIVNISSVLGELGCAGLVAYASSKAALTTLHASIRAELNAMASDRALVEHHPGLGNIKMVLSRPGQLGTTMFRAVKPPSEFLGPTVETSALAAAIVKAVESGRDAEVSMPLYARLIGFMRVLPAGLQQLARDFAGLDKAGWRAFGQQVRSND